MQAAQATGRVALVSGGSKGIGAATTLALARSGFHVAVNFSSNAANAEKIVKDVEGLGTGVKGFAIKADIGDVTEAQRLVEETVKHFGKLSVLVNNAGIAIYKPLAAATEEDFDKSYRLNVKAPFFLTQAAVPHLKAGDSIIFISTSLTGANTVMPPYAIYQPTKGAVEQLARVLTKDLGTKGIRVNTVSPGPTATELFFNGKSPEMVKTIEGFSPFNRLGKPEEIADAIDYLVGEKASWCSGQNLRVNGGFVFS